MRTYVTCPVCHRLADPARLDRGAAGPPVLRAAVLGGRARIAWTDPVEAGRDWLLYLRERLLAALARIETLLG